MKKALKLIPKQPRTIKEFWAIFTEKKDILDDNQVEFDNTVKDIKCDITDTKTKLEHIEKKVDTYKKIMVFLTVVSILIAFGGFVIQKMQLDDALSKNLISYVTANEHPKRMGDDELYQLTLHNYGEVENDLQLTITFTLETKIITIFNIEPEGLKINESLSGLNSTYFIRYEKIHAGEDIVIRLDIIDDRLTTNESLLIYPKYIDAYTDTGKINVYRSFNE
ncbi:MAG: hypothetical protein IMZ43_08855 [Thermoplasmata archaeon]|nr:hypothetical protein [Thermoplasmata archaeon]